MKSIGLTTAAIICGCISTTAVNGATITVQTGADAMLGHRATNAIGIDADQASTNVGELSAQSQSAVDEELSAAIFSQTNLVRVGEASAAAIAEANVSDGVMRFRIDQTHDHVGVLDGTATTGSSSASATAIIRESFFVSGTGNFTALLAFDASWQGAGGVTGQANIRFTNLGGGAGYNLSGDSGMIDDEIIAAGRSFTNAFNQQVDVTWQILGQVNSVGLNGSSFLDATNSGTIFFEASDGLSVTAADPNFLATSVYLDDINNTSSGSGGGATPTPAPVPLPASLPLMLVGLGALGLWKSRKVVV